MLQIIFVVASLFLSSVSSEEKDCELSRYVMCMEPIHNVTIGHEHGLFQSANDLADNCPVIRTSIQCIRTYVKDCGHDMIAEDFNEQFEKPATLLDQICTQDSVMRTDYLKASPCMLENHEDFDICPTKVQEFLSVFEPDTEPKERTVTCMYEMMLRACFMSTAAEKCGLDAANFVRRALNHSPSQGLKMCFNEDESA